MVSLWCEFFIYGPSNVHLSAFYLNQVCCPSHPSSIYLHLMYPYRLYMVIDLEEPKHYYPQQSAAQGAVLVLPTEILEDGPMTSGKTRSADLQK